MTAPLLEEKSANVKRVTVYAGYGLFLFNVIAAMLAVAPWIQKAGFLDGSYYVEPGRVVVSLLGASVIPPLVGFFIGLFASRHVKLGLIKQYNGVLLGVLSMWVVLVVSMATSYAEWVFLFQSRPWSYVSWIIPLVIAAAIAAGLATFYSKQVKHDKSIMQYGPFRGVMVGAVVAFMLMLGASSFFGAIYGGNLAVSLLISFVFPLSVASAIVATTYRSLLNYPYPKSVRWTYSLVVLGFLFAGLYAANQIAASISSGSSVAGAVWGGVAIIAWGSYIILVHRLLK